MNVNFDPLSQTERQALRTMLDALEANRQSAGPFPVLSTAAASVLPTAPAVLQPGPATPAPVAVPPAATPENTVAPVPTVNAWPQLNPAGVAVDSEGYPWDARIHASTRTMTQAGKWVARRGLNDEAGVNRIKAEIKAAAELPVIQGADPAATFGGAPVLMPPAATPLPAPPAVAAPLPPVPQSGPANFEQLFARLTPAANTGQVPKDALDATLAALGVQGGAIMLVQRPDYVPHVWTHLTQQYPVLLGG